MCLLSGHGLTGLGKTFVGSEKLRQLGNKVNLVVCQKSPTGREGGKKVKRKIVEMAFVVSFILTGCGIDSIFASKGAAITWGVSLAVLILSAMAIGGINDKK